MLLQPRSYGYIFEETGQDRGTVGQRCRDYHAVRLDAAQFSGVQICYHHYFAAYEILRLIGEGQPGDDLAYFVADIDLQLQQLVSAGDALGSLHLSDAHLDFGKVLDADL